MNQVFATVLAAIALAAGPALADNPIGTVQGPPLIGGPLPPHHVLAHPQVAPATTLVSITNHSNEAVIVAIYYAAGIPIAGGWVQVQGWHVIEPNRTYRFQVPVAAQAFLRVESNAGEILFNGYTQQLAPAPVVMTPDFSVMAYGHDPQTVALRWGNAGEHFQNALRYGPLPPGWELRRFFSIGSGPLVELTVTP
jgi:hypothetical protein